MKIQKNIEIIKQLITKYENALRKLSSNKPSHLDSDKICKNILVMYNDVVIACYNTYAIFVAYTKNPNKKELKEFEDLFTKLNQTQCSFIEKIVNGLLKMLNIPTSISKAISEKKYSNLSKAIINKMQVEKSNKPLNFSSTSVLEKIQRFSNAISSITPEQLSNYLSSDASKFLDHVLAFCLTYATYMENVVQALNIAYDSDMTDSETVSHLEDYIEFFSNIVKSKKEIPLETCNNPNIANQILSDAEKNVVKNKTPLF